MNARCEPANPGLNQFGKLNCLTNFQFTGGRIHTSTVGCEAKSSTEKRLPRANPCLNPVPRKPVLKPRSGVYDIPLQIFQGPYCPLKIVLTSGKDCVTNCHVCVSIHFLQARSSLVNKAITGFSDACLKRLLEYDYPGNILELRHIVENTRRV